MAAAVTRTENFVTVVVIFVAVVVNRGRMPTAGQLTDLITPDEAEDLSSVLS